MTLPIYVIKNATLCCDLPKKMPIPQVGSVVFVDEHTFIVKRIDFTVWKGSLHMITVWAE